MIQQTIFFNKKIKYQFENDGFKLKHLMQLCKTIFIAVRCMNQEIFTICKISLKNTKIAETIIFIT